MVKLNELTSLKEQVEALKDSVDFVTSQNDDIVDKMQKFQSEIKFLKKENERQKTELESLRRSVNGLEAVQLRKQCFLRADVSLIKEDVKSSVTEIVNKAGCNLNDEDIEFAAVQSKLSHNNTKVVKLGFQSFDAKLKVMKSKKKLKDDEVCKDVVIYDVLSQDTLNVFKYAKELTKVGYHSVFTVGARVLVRRHENGSTQWIRSKQEVDDMIKRAAGGARGDNVTLRMSQVTKQRNTKDKERLNRPRISSNTPRGLHS